MAIFELNEKQLKVIELMIKGVSISDIAKQVKCSRTSINTWRQDEKFKAELDKQVKALKSKVDERLLINLEPLLDRLVDIALHSDSDKTSLDAIIYAINRLCGTPTNKTQDITVTTEKKEPIDVDKMLSDIKAKKMQSYS